MGLGVGGGATRSCSAVEAVHPRKGKLYARQQPPDRTGPPPAGTGAGARRAQTAAGQAPALSSHATSFSESTDVTIRQSYRIADIR